MLSYGDRELNIMTNEKFHIPAVAGIVEKTISGEKHILIQERMKSEAPSESGLLEIPGGKIREFENIFSALKREILEETGALVTDIEGDNQVIAVKRHGYHVISCDPFYVAQNISESYPVMVLIFLCRVTDDTMMKKSDESENIRWISVAGLKEVLTGNPERFYLMHVGALKKYVEQY